MRILYKQKQFIRSEFDYGRKSTPNNSVGGLKSWPPQPGLFCEICALHPGYPGAKQPDYSRIIGTNEANGEGIII
jgi:hypothetical protein